MMRRSGITAVSGVLALAALFAQDAAAPHSMSVPFFRDDGDAIGTNGPQTGGAGMITVTNTRDQPVTMYLVYALNDFGGQASTQQQVPYVLGAKRTVQWRPVKTDPAEGSGQNVPNVLPGSGNFGNLTIYWTGGDEMTGALIGRYQEFSRSDTMMHVLLEDRSDS